MKKPRLAFVSFLALSFAAACSKGSGAAGTYELDKEAIKAAMPAESKADAAAETQKMLADWSGTIELKSDGTVTATMKMPPFNSSQETGTWKLDGTHLTMTFTKAGKEETRRAELVNGVITAEGGGPKTKATMSFKKK